MFKFKIREAYLCRVTVKTYYEKPNGSKNGSFSTVNHPSFEALRDLLITFTLIDPSASTNGDTCLSAFSVNGYVFRAGEDFPSAGAISIKFQDDYEYYGGVEW